MNSIWNCAGGSLGFWSYLFFFFAKYILTFITKTFFGSFFLVKIIPSKFISDSDFNKTKTIVCKRLQLDSAPLHRCHRPYPNLFLRFRDLLILCLFYFDVTLDFQASAGCFFCLIRWVWLSQIVLKWLKIVPCISNSMHYGIQLIFLNYLLIQYQNR